MMIVYHGTGRYSMKALLEDGPQVYPRAYLKGRRAFSTTTDFKIAALFALRRSPPSVLHGDESEMGVVIEYKLSGKKGKDWVPAVCGGTLQDEEEIAVLHPEVLEPIAVWALKAGGWASQPIEAMKCSRFTAGLKA